MKKIKEKWVLLFLLVFVFIIRLIPFFKGSSPLGYDTGLYRGRFSRLDFLDISEIAKNEPPFLYYLVDILQNLGLSTDFILLGLYFLFNIVLGIFIFLFLRKKYSYKIGLAGLFLFSVSLVQFEAYFSMYYKNILAFILTLIIFYLIEKKSWLIILIGGILLAVHPMSFVLLFSALFLTLIFNKEKRKYLLFSSLGMIGLGLLFYLNNFYPLIHYLPTNINKFQNIINIDESVKTGSFWNISLFIFYTIWYLPLAIWAIVQKVKNKKLDYLVWYFIICSLIIIFGFFFYKRFLVHFDFIIILISAPILIKLFDFIKKKKEKFYYILFLLMIIFLLVRVFIFSYTSEPLIDDKNLLEIKNLRYLDGVTIISGDSSVAPWVYGYSEQETIWPGKFKNDKWKKKEWDIFWSTENLQKRYELLDQYDGSLYICLDKDQDELRKIIENDKTFRKYSDNVWEYFGDNEL
ncbi:MAG: hypothetical protein ABIF17_02995 [Patescibacteria group bacterium]